MSTADQSSINRYHNTITPEILQSKGEVPHDITRRTKSLLKRGRTRSRRTLDIETPRSTIYSSYSSFWVIAFFIGGSFWWYYMSWQPTAFQTIAIASLSIVVAAGVSYGVTHYTLQKDRETKEPTEVIDEDQIEKQEAMMIQEHVLRAQKYLDERKKNKKPPTPRSIPDVHESIPPMLTRDKEAVVSSVLDLSFRGMDDVSLGEVWKHHAQNLSSVTHLDLTGNSLTHQGIISIFRAGIHKLELRRLCLNRNQIGDSGINLLSTLIKRNHFSCLEELEVAQNHVTVLGLSCLFHSLLDSDCSLKVLNLSGNMEYSEGRTNEDWFVDSLKSMSRDLSANPSITHLDLSFNHFGPTAFTLFCRSILSSQTRGISPLKKLDLCSCSLGCGIIDAIQLVSFFEGMEELHIGSNDHSKEREEEKNYAPPTVEGSEMKRLDLSSNHIGISSQPMWNWLIETMDAFQHIYRLDISNNDIGGDLDRCAALGYALSKLETLRELDLSLNGLDDEAVYEMMENLFPERDAGVNRKYPRIRYLNLSGNNIVDMDIDGLSRSLWTLRVLNLSDNHIDDIGALSIVDRIVCHHQLSMRSRFSLSHLYLSGNPLTRDTRWRIFEDIGGEIALEMEDVEEFEACIEEDKEEHESLTECMWVVGLRSTECKLTSFVFTFHPFLPWSPSLAGHPNSALSYQVPTSVTTLFLHRPPSLKHLLNQVPPQTLRSSERDGDPTALHFPSRETSDDDALNSLSLSILFLIRDMCDTRLRDQICEKVGSQICSLVIHCNPVGVAGVQCPYLPLRTVPLLRLSRRANGRTRGVSLVCIKLPRAKVEHFQKVTFGRPLNVNSYNNKRSRECIERRIACIRCVLDDIDIGCLFSISSHVRICQDFGGIYSWERFNQNRVLLDFPGLFVKLLGFLSVPPPVVLRCEQEQDSKPNTNNWNERGRASLREEKEKRRRDEFYIVRLRGVKSMKTSAQTQGRERVRPLAPLRAISTRKQSVSRMASALNKVLGNNNAPTPVLTPCLTPFLVSSQFFSRRTPFVSREHLAGLDDQLSKKFELFDAQAAESSEINLLQLGKLSVADCRPTNALWQ
ncbi:hypothetical protein PROFUN_07371 [Planoprotostelium fungivorum]|uniref:Uncharacterized protein n=1 Tax=Planoprotostelium fungivorum TaxID=1890364 RepID=A0A2P6MTE3_9EUKA|nr:hypothetical protein PROFUN_07371 [Planoprotostelium fungivorum]